MRLHALLRRRREPASRTLAVVELCLGVDDVLQRQDAILVAREPAPFGKLSRRAILLSPALAAEAFAPAGSAAVAGTVFHEFRDFLVPTGDMCSIHDFALVVDDSFANVGATRVSCPVKRLSDTAGYILQPNDEGLYGNGLCHLRLQEPSDMAEPPGRHERLATLAQDIDNIHGKTPFAISLHAMTARSCDAIDSAQPPPAQEACHHPRRFGVDAPAVSLSLLNYSGLLQAPTSSGEAARWGVID